jgi:hypothetical protein
MRRKLWIAAMSLIIFAAAGPVPSEAVAAAGCYTEGSKCVYGTDCCSGKCERFPEGTQLCTAEDSET